MSRELPKYWVERRIPERDSTFELRSKYERDRGRLIHCPTFRRLQRKTQVLSAGEGDYHRTRMTHSMEVAQIARGLLQRLEKDNDDKLEFEILPDNDLVETLALAHDLGHPPFGHNGEVALNFLMRDHGGFESNGHALRIVSRLEKRLLQGEPKEGLNFTRRTLLGLLKYPQTFNEARRRTLPAPPQNIRLLNQDDWKPPKCYLGTEREIVEWIIKPLGEDGNRLRERTPPTDQEHGKTIYKSLDCSIMDLADDIAYATHDLEDGIALRFITQDDWDGLIAENGVGDAWNSWMDRDRESIPTIEVLSKWLFKDGVHRRKAISEMLGCFIHSVELDRLAVFRSPLLQYKAVLPIAIHDFVERLKNLAFGKFVRDPALQTLEYRGRILIMKIFEALASDPAKLLRQPHCSLYKMAAQDQKLRIICDFVAGMTDDYASHFYERLFVPGSRSAFDKL